MISVSTCLALRQVEPFCLFVFFLHARVISWHSKGFALWCFFIHFSAGVLVSFYQIPLHHRDGHALLVVLDWVKNLFLKGSSVSSGGFRKVTGCSGTARTIDRWGRAGHPWLTGAVMGEKKQPWASCIRVYVDSYKTAFKEILYYKCKCVPFAGHRVGNAWASP